MREQKAQAVAPPDVPGPVLVYDGDCGFCTRTAAWLVARGGATARAAHTLDLSPADAARSLEAAGWMVGGEVETWGAPAIAAGLRHRGGASRVLGRCLTLPVVRTLADLVYGWVARNRHRMPGATAQCRIDQAAPQPEQPWPGQPRLKWFWSTWSRRVVTFVVVLQVMVPAIALTHPPSRFGFQMFSGLGGTEIEVLDAEGKPVVVDTTLLPPRPRPDMPYADALPEFLCLNVVGAATVTVRHPHRGRSIQC